MVGLNRIIQINDVKTNQSLSDKHSNRASSRRIAFTAFI